jgi:predicted dehydrogenase
MVRFSIHQEVAGFAMAKTIKVGVITHAQGAHLDAYFGALAQIEEVEAVALADPSGKTSALARKTLGTKLGKTYQDSNELLREFQPAMALISMEAALAPPALDAALEAGCHVFAEKPSCVRAADFAKLARKAQEKHRHLMLALANRVHAPVQEARRLLQAGILGKVYATEIHLVADQTRLKREAYRKEWFCHKARAGGGQLIWLGIHWLDLAMYITGLKVQQVAGFAGVVGGQPIDVEDSAAVALRFDNGSFGTMTSGYYLDKGYHSHVQIWGESGWLKLASFEEAPLEWYSTRKTRAPKVERFDYPRGGRGYTPFVRAAVRASAGLEPPPIAADEGLHVLKTIFAFYQAAQTGQVQHVG